MTKRQRTENITGSSGSGGNKKGEKPMSALEEAMLQAKAEASALTGGGVGGDGAGGALASLAPQKVNADLKRDIKGKLDRLERRQRQHRPCGRFRFRLRHRVWIDFEGNHRALDVVELSIKGARHAGHGHNR